ncbi:sperm acrosome-associated protein 9 [Phocoena phocoena]|uniref:sperm acrosome-associated protein 9 n=1 Tax=Phocoena phocoena TaxID=9742 RepID=UPI00330754F5
MNEVKESLRSVEQKYQLFQQQQFTFIAALEHCRENASDKIRPISSIGQVEARGCPPDMANCLSCHEVRNHCGGVVSLIPIVLDMMKEWVAHSEKLPCKVLQHVSEPQATGTQPRLRKDKGRLSFCILAS